MISQTVLTNMRTVICTWLWACARLALGVLETNLHPICRGHKKVSPLARMLGILLLGFGGRRRF